MKALWSGATTGGLDGLEGISIHPWAVDLDAGTYRVRWSYEAQGRREQRGDLVTVTAQALARLLE